MKQQNNQISILDDVDRYEKAREEREKAQTIAKLDEKCTRLRGADFTPDKLPAGSVIIIGQNLFRNGRYTMHFYRAVLGYHNACAYDNVPHLVEQQTEEWPDIPPWAGTVGHEGEPRDIHVNYHNNMYWATGEVTEPIIRWIDAEMEKTRQWMKERKLI